MPDDGPEPAPTTAGRVVDRLRARGFTVATGESVTAGLVAATLAEVPGCSAVLRGGIIAYQVDVKADLLRVPPEALAEGVVSAAVAVAMARGSLAATGAQVGVGTTGVAGPDPHDGEPVGSVWVAVVAPGFEQARHLQLTGDRADIRCQTVAACWDLLLHAVPAPGE